MSAAGDTADAVVIGSGPNGLVAAITLARKGWAVTVIERDEHPGGAVRTEALTAPGFLHDTFSGFYGLLHASPVFDRLELGRRIEWAQFDTPVAAAVSPERAASIHRDPSRTIEELGADGEAWGELLAWWEKAGRRFFQLTLAPIGAIRPALRFARAVGIRGALPTARRLIAPISEVAADTFASEEARALLASGITHSDVSAEAAGSTPFALILAMLAQTSGMPVPVGGAGVITDALVAALTDAGGVIRTGDAATRVAVARGRALAVETANGAVVRARHAVLADTGPLALCRDLVGEEHFPAPFLDGLRRFRYGTGIFKMDIALDGITPWLLEQLRATGVVHVVGTVDDMARAHFEASHGALPARPSLVVGQQTVADPSRAPAGKHTLWIETHVPAHPPGGWERAREPFSERVFDLIEQHAPGFRDRIVGTAVHTPADLESRNPNLVGGDLGGGSAALHQQLVFRPVPGWFRYRTPVKGLYLCSASTHPGGGVHGMSGLNAAKRALRDARRPAGVLRTAGSARRAPRPA